MLNIKVLYNVASSIVTSVATAGIMFPDSNGHQGENKQTNKTYDEPGFRTVYNCTWRIDRRVLHKHLPDCPGQVKFRFGQAF